MTGWGKAGGGGGRVVLKEVGNPILMRWERGIQEPGVVDGIVWWGGGRTGRTTVDELSVL